jgi:hypothetical protein
VAQVFHTFRSLDKWIRMRTRCFRLKRKTRHANRQLPTRKLEKWGLLSLQRCRPGHRISYMRSFRTCESRS